MQQHRQADAPIPRHVAIIMDGNGRWAERRGLSRIEGHRAGLESVRAVVRAAHELETVPLQIISELRLEGRAGERAQVGGIEVVAEPRKRNFRRAHRAAGLGMRFEDQHLPAGARKQDPGSEAVVPGPDDNRVKHRDD